MVFLVYAGINPAWRIKYYQDYFIMYYFFLHYYGKRLSFQLVVRIYQITIIGHNREIKNLPLHLYHPRSGHLKAYQNVTESYSSIRGVTWEIQQLLYLHEC